VRYVLAAVVLLLVVGTGCVSPGPRTGTDETEGVWSPSVDGPMPARDSRRGGYWWQPSVAGTDSPGNRGVLFSRAPAVKEKSLTEETQLEEVQPLAEVIDHPVKVIERIVLNDVLFDYDRSELTPVGKNEVERLARYLNDNIEILVVIEGHTDWIASEKYNLALGARRAESVKQALADLGVAEERMATVSFGESRPIATNDTVEGRALNRRAVINVVMPDDADGAVSSSP